MQIKADFTEKELLESDILFETCHAVEKLLTVSTLLHCYPHGPFTMTRETIVGAANIVEDCTNEISYLIELGQTQWNKDHERIKTLETVLGDFIAFLEDPDQKPDLKTMAANLRKKMR